MDNLQIPANVAQLIGGILIAIAYLPQLRQIIRTKSVKDINFSYVLMVFIAICLFEFYAIVTYATHGVAGMFLITNTISVCMSGGLVGLVWVNRKVAK